MNLRVADRRFWKMLALLSLTGCRGSGTPSEDGPRISPPVLTEHRVRENGAGQRALGENCTNGSHSDCASGLCIHAAIQGPARADSGYICSRTCQKPKDCPSNWQCQQILPTAPERICTPPRKEAMPSQQEHSPTSGD